MKVITSMLALVILLSACCRGSQEKRKQTQNDELIFKNDSSVFVESRVKLLKAVEISLKDLDSLTEKQRNAISLLILVCSEVEGISVGDHLDHAYKNKLAKLVNPIQPNVALLKPLDLKTKYLQAELKCLLLDKDSSETINDWQDSQTAVNRAARDIQQKLTEVQILLKVNKSL
jgi:hypothetical protein